MAVGISMNSHYCGGYLLDTYIYAEPECAFCDRHDEPREKDCCDDETEFFSISDDHTPATLKVDLFSPEMSQPDVPFTNGPVLNLSRLESGTYANHDPPPSGESLHLLYHQFIHYG